MVDTIRKGSNEFYGIYPLPQQMTRIKIETESLPASDGFKSALSRNNVKCDLGGVDFQGKLDPIFVKNIKDRMPHVAKIFKPVFNLLFAHRWKGINKMPYGRSREPVYDF